MRKAFTLIELLIVVSIIGILAVALVPSLTDAPARARDAARDKGVNDLIGAIEGFNIDNERYPSAAFWIGDVGGSVTADETALINDYFNGSAPGYPCTNTDSPLCDDDDQMRYLYQAGSSSAGYNYRIYYIIEINNRESDFETSDPPIYVRLIER